MSMIPFRHPRGRRRLPEVDPATLEVLGIPQTLSFCKAKGRPIGRAKLMSAIASGTLPAVEDLLCVDRRGNPLLKIRRVDLERWLHSTLRPI